MKTNLVPLSEQKNIYLIRTMASEIKLSEPLHVSTKQVIIKFLALQLAIESTAVLQVFNKHTWQKMLLQ